MLTWKLLICFLDDKIPHLVTILRKKIREVISPGFYQVERSQRAEILQSMFNVVATKDKWGENEEASYEK
jgi:hypothetical protein